MKIFSTLKMFLHLSIISAVVLIGVFCSTEKKATAPLVAGAVPTVLIISPTADTTVASSDDSIVVTVTFKDVASVGVDSVYVGSIGYAYASINDTFNTTITLTTDTTVVIAKVIATDKRTSADTVTIYKAASTIPTGRAVISGVLLQDATSRKLGGIKTRQMARNAQGTKRAVTSVYPITGADILLYDSDSFSTSSDTSVKTDSTGNWSIDVDPGNYYVFAVYFDQENLELITAALPDIEAVVNKETKTDSTTAINDEIDPYVNGILDASEANDDNLFIASDIPANLPIVIVFSEPMNRKSTGDSISGIVFGPVNADSSSLPFTDTISVQKLWGPNGKELRLIPNTALTIGTTYKVLIPNSSKDLALNKLDETYSGVFGVIDAAELPAFALKNTSPAIGDTVSVVTPIEFIFTRPIDMLSLNKNYTITSATDTAVYGYFEGQGNVARFVNKKEMKNSATYTVTVASGFTDLLGDSLGTKATLTFTTKAKDVLEDVVGIKGEIAAVVNGFMGAYLAGDIETFGQAFHSNFELVQTVDTTEVRLQKDEFLQERRDDIEQQERLKKFGFLAPKYYTISNTPCWKLTKGAVVAYVEDNFGGFGKTQKVFAADSSDITDSVSWIDRGVIIGTDTLIIHPDMSKSFIDENTQDNDPTVFGKLLKNETNVETQEIFMEIKDKFSIKSIEATEGVDSAQIMIELTTTESYKDGKYPFAVDPQNPPKEQQNVTAIQIKVIKESATWMVIQMVANDLYSGNKDDFKPGDIDTTKFIIQDVQQTQAIEFKSPVQKAVSVTAPITFAWTAPTDPNVGGYIFAISDELSGGNRGLLLFSTDTTLTISATGAVTGATIISKDPKLFSVPLPQFSASLTSFSIADSAIYTWKVVAVPDTSAFDIVENQLKVIADSDFGGQGGIGIFTLLATMPDFTNDIGKFDPNKNVGDHFSDMDGDYYPDWIENAFGTDPNNSGEYPNFKIDNDKDGFADFLEVLAGTNPDDINSVPVDLDSNNMPDTIEAAPGWDPMLSKDDDKDGFPNEIENIFGTDPWNKDSKPTSIVKPLAPTGKYYGMIKFDGTDTAKSIQISITSDENGDFATVDSTQIANLPKDGIGVQTDLLFNNGEWVFYIPIETGLDAGKFIKIRFHSQNGVLDGPIDLADMKPGGGPFIGNFVGSTDPNFDFQNYNPGNNNIIEDNNTINIGPSSEQDVTRPDSNSFDLSLTMTYDSLTGVTATLIANGDTMVDPGVFWNPTQGPALSFNFTDTSGSYRLDANLHRNGDKQAKTDSLVLVGNYHLELTGNKISDYQCTLILTSYGDDEWKPAGTWSGWYATNSNIQNNGPLAFIGDSVKVYDALTLTGMKVVIEDVNKDSVFTVTSFESFKPDTNMQNGLWVAVVGTDKYEILEMPGDYNNVWVKDVGSDKVVVVKTSGPNNGPGPMFYMGDSASVFAALVTSSNIVSIPTPQPGQFNDITVDPLTITKFVNPKNSAEFAWVIQESGTGKEFVIEGNKDDSLVMSMNGSKPIVFDKALMQQP